jgi:hypothetical protein
LTTASFYGGNAESVGLYGSGFTVGGTYFQWFVFQSSSSAPATPTGGSWDFTTNTGIPPTGWSTTPPASPTTLIWVSIALVNSKNASNLTWSTPGQFAYSSGAGLPVLSGASAPTVGDGVQNQIYIQLSTPQKIWFREAGGWVEVVGPNGYVNLVDAQTIAGTKTFSNEIQGSISGTASNVTGIVGITNGGTGSTSASAARTALGLGTSADVTFNTLTATNGISGGTF